MKAQGGTEKNNASRHSKYNILFEKPNDQLFPSSLVISLAPSK